MQASRVLFLAASSVFLISLRTAALDETVLVDKGEQMCTIISEKTLSEKGSTRATAYDMSNKIITADGKLFVTWLDFLADIKTAAYDIQSGQLSEIQLIGQGTDNHSGPALTMDSNGYLHIVYGPHHGAFQYRRSVKPLDGTEWTPVERFAEKGTYPSLVCGPDDTLYCAYRDSSTDPWRLLIQRRSKDGEWSPPLAIVDAGVKGYAQFGNSLAISGERTLHLAFHIYNSPPAEGGRSAGYLRSDDGGRTWETADGASMEIPVTAEQVSTCTLGVMPALAVACSIHDLRSLNSVSLEYGCFVEQCPRLPENQTQEEQDSFSSKYPAGAGIAPKRKPLVVTWHSDVVRQKVGPDDGGRGRQYPFAPVPVLLLRHASFHRHRPVPRGGRYFVPP